MASNILNTADRFILSFQIHIFQANIDRVDIQLHRRCVIGLAQLFHPRNVHVRSGSDHVHQRVRFYTA